MRFLLGEFLTRAALMSLVLAVAEWIWPSLTFAGQPGKRLYFIAFWAALMAGFQYWLVREKARAPDST